MSASRPERGSGDRLSPEAGSPAPRVATVERAIVRVSAEVVRERLATLREQTASLHDAVERQVDIADRVCSVHSYTDLLARLYGFYAPFEEELGAVVARAGLPYDVEARRKAPLIVRDLAALGRPAAVVAALPLCAGVPRPDNPAAALGCLYVVEGATLGGRLIARLVEHRLGIGPQTGGAFFNGYGPQVGPRWHAFCSVLADALRCRAAERDVVAAARATFVAFGRWLAVDGAG